MNTSTLKKAMQIANIIKQHYEKGNQKKCFLQVYRYHIKDTFGISISTYKRYIKIIQDLGVI